MIFLLLYFVYPYTYQSTVTVLPPEKNSQMSGLGSLIAGQEFGSLLDGGLSSANSQLFMEIIKSRSAAEYVVKKHKLEKYYDAEDVYDAAKMLSNNLNVEVTKEGIIKLSVDVKTSLLPSIFDSKTEKQKLSADLSNSFVEALDIINRDKLSSKAKRARIYIEEQLQKTKTQLDSVESALMRFQRSNKAISLPEQVSAAIDAAANLKTEIIKTEIELNMVQPNLREDNKTLIALRSKLAELRDQYAKLELGNQDYLVAFKEVPELGRELASLLREVKIQNEVYTLLQQQFYKEKIQENRDLPTVEILDEAIPPKRPSSPRTIFSTFFGGVFVFMLVSLIFVFREKNSYKFNKSNQDKENV